MHTPNLTRFQHSYAEKCGFLTRGVSDCCIHGTENVKNTQIDFHTEKWCGNKCTKSEEKGITVAKMCCLVQRAIFIVIKL